MIEIRIINRILTICVVTCIFVFSAVADDEFSETSSERLQYVRGVISKVYTDSMQISVRLPKGKRVRINIHPGTALEGLSEFKEFKRDQQIKVWYLPEKGINQAARIKKLIQGC